MEKHEIGSKGITGQAVGQPEVVLRSDDRKCSVKQYTQG